MENIQHNELVNEKRFDKWIKVGAIVLGSLIVIILIILGLAEVISLTMAIVGIAITLFVVIIVYVFFYFFNKPKNLLDTKNQVKAITLEQARELARNATRCVEYMDYCDEGLGEWIWKLGEGNDKTPIYGRKARGEYQNDIYVILINMYYPDEKNIMINPSEEKIEREANLLARAPTTTIEEQQVIDYPGGVRETKIRKAVSHDEKLARDQEEKDKQEDI